MQLSLLLLLVTAVCGDLVEYYENLINAEIKRAATYQFPKDAREYQPLNTIPKEYGVFDFVVIGGGSAGAVVASRLSENPKWRILLLEAGKDENDFTDIPSMTPFLSNLEYNWGFNSTPQSNCCQAMGGRCPFPRGKSLGGTSTINSLVYSRGNKLDFDKWAELGNPGWSFKDVLPYFIKSEKSHVKGDIDYHGHHGLLNVEYHRSVSPKIPTFLKASIELNRTVVDVNGKQQLGASYNNFNTVKGKRHSTSRAFLTAAKNRKNLKILTESYATKILIDESSKTAHGVLFSYKKILYVAHVKKEVITSAGVVGSPTLLMHSGIGPKDHLSKFNISTIQDLKVGHNMHDHLTFSNFYVSTTLYEHVYSLKESIKLYLNGTGPFTITTNPQGISFAQINSNRSKVPEFELIFVPHTSLGGFTSIDGTTRSTNLSSNVAQLVVVLLHPKTRGSVYLNSSDPYVYPIIDSKCLCDERNEDVENLYEGILKLLELVETDSFRQIGAEVLADPRCSNFQFKTKDYWMCLIRETSMNAYHGGGTCKMGPDQGKGAVVDNRLRVHGVKNLRVADASVVPVTLSGHMSAPAIMIGERVADFIKFDHRHYI
ncbi:hypothetical protein FQA39_LY17730 [Lamprigera yunnana]|nr:hypothetical protein FQA39_LY17730 [Lamprigera yunnana]